MRTHYSPAAVISTVVCGGRSRARRVGVSIIGALMLLPSAGTAEAHVVGRMEVTGSSGGTAVSVGGYGPLDGQCGYADGYPTGAARAAASGGSVTISVSRNQDLVNRTWCRQLGAGENTVRLWPGAQFVRDGGNRWVSPGHWLEYPGPCRDQGIIIGTMDVNHRGNASATFGLPDNLVSNGGSDAAALCVYSTTDAARSNFVPLIIVP